MSQLLSQPRLHNPAWDVNIVNTCQDMHRTCHWKPQQGDHAFPRSGLLAWFLTPLRRYTSGTTVLLAASRRPVAFSSYHSDSNTSAVLDKPIRTKKLRTKSSMTSGRRTTCPGGVAGLMPAAAAAAAEEPHAVLPCKVTSCTAAERHCWFRAYMQVAGLEPIGQPAPAKVECSNKGIALSQRN